MLRAKMLCQNCGCRFDVDLDIGNDVCPSCGSSNVVIVENNDGVIDQSGGNNE